MLGYVNKGKTVMEFDESFIIKDAIWCAANVWNSINSEIVQNTCRHLLPTIIFKDDNAIDFEGFSGREITIYELLDYAKAENVNLHENDVDEIVCVGYNVSIAGFLKDQKCDWIW